MYCFTILFICSHRRYFRTRICFDNESCDLCMSKQNCTKLICIDNESCDLCMSKQNCTKLKLDTFRMYVHFFGPKFSKQDSAGRPLT